MFSKWAGATPHNEHMPAPCKHGMDLMQVLAQVKYSMAHNMRDMQILLAFLSRCAQTAESNITPLEPWDTEAHIKCHLQVAGKAKEEHHPASA